MPDYRIVVVEGANLRFLRGMRAAPLPEIKKMIQILQGYGDDTCYGYVRITRPEVKR